MIGERTKLLFKVWGVTRDCRQPNLPRKSLKTMDSYCSHIDKYVTELFDVTHDNGVIIQYNELQAKRDNIEHRRANAAGDTKAALRALREFLDWLMVGEKFGVNSVLVLAELNQSTPYVFLNSYDTLFTQFGIDLNAFIAYAMRPDVTYFASTQQALASWNDLRVRLLNHEPLFIRGKYPLFSLFYQEVFGNINVVGDKDGNTAPIDALSRATGVTTRAKDPEYKVLVNYKLSHIYARPNNPLMFSGLYNIAFTPSIVDGFTEEVQGLSGIEFRHAFRTFVHERFGMIYSQFKQFTDEWEIHQRIDAFNPPGFPAKSLIKFRQLAHSDWATVFEIPD